MTDFVELDLRELRRELGDHWDTLSVNDYTLSCECGESVGQDKDHCEFCGRSVIWQGSQLWKSLYGSPNQAKKRLLAEQFRPSDPLGIWLCQEARVEGFANLSEKRDWTRASKVLDPEAFKKAISGWKQSQAQKGYRNSGRALMGFAVNLARKTLRESVRHKEGQEHIEIRSW